MSTSGRGESIVSWTLVGDWGELQLQFTEAQAQELACDILNELEAD